MKSEELGRAEIRPAGAFAVGATGTWTITHTVGRFGIDDRGSLLIAQRDMTDAGALQCEDPNAPGYVSVSTTGQAKLTVRYDSRVWIRPWRGALVVMVDDGSLSPGDRVEVTLGGWTLQTFPETAHEFRVLVDCFGTRAYYPVSEHPPIAIVPGAPSRLDAVLPSAVRPGEEVPVRIRVLDAWDNPVGDFSGEVMVHRAGEVSGFPKTFDLCRGVQKVGTICFREEGAYRLTLRCGALSGRSNPIYVSEAAQPVFWGDMHGQTEEAIGTGTVEEYFRFARDKALVDVTSWQGNDFQITDALWREVCKQTKECYEPGRFVTFLGYEWSGLTPAGGDHNIMYLEDDQPVHRSAHWLIHDGSSEAEDRYPLSALWDQFEGRRDVMAIAHVGGRHANLDFWNPDFSGLVEIHSQHGTFEWLAEDALRRGFVVGFVGQSDDHSGRPGFAPPFRPLMRGFAIFDLYGGLTGIYASELTRPAIWEALRARHCYATTGQRIVLDVRCGQYMMGDVVEEACPAEIAVHVVGTAPLLDVEVRRDTEVVYRTPFAFDPETAWVRVEWSGVRVKSRGKDAVWDGAIRVKHGRIEAFRAFAFDREGEGVVQQSDTALTVTSTTSGDIDGVLLKVSDPEALVAFECEAIHKEVAVKELTQVPQVFQAGGVDRQVRFSLCSWEDRPVEARFVFQDPNPPEGRHAYWVKVVQMDGHMAWSSPLFVGY